MKLPRSHRTTLAGLRPATGDTATPELAGRVDEAVTALNDHGVGLSSPAVAFTVPGRIEVLGKHTDYAGGPSLVAASRQGLVGVAVPRDDRALQLLDVGRGLVARIPYDRPVAAAEEPWSSYFALVAARLQELVALGPGVTLAFDSTLPRAAGLSSSSMLVVAAYLALTLFPDPELVPKLHPALAGREIEAEFLGAVEAGRPFLGTSGAKGVGTRGGSQDHTAILCSEPGMMGLYAYAPIRRLRALPMPEDHLFAVAASGVRAAKTGNARERYNRAADLARTAAEVWRRASGCDHPHLAAAVAGAPGGAPRVREALERSSDRRFATSDLLRRFDHFSLESTLVSSAVAALERGDLGKLGGIVDRSQAGAEELLGNQVPETSTLAGCARDLGARAASGFGAGFGGSVWALIPKPEASGFLEKWRDAYLRVHPEHLETARFLATEAGAGARLLT